MSYFLCPRLFSVKLTRLQIMKKMETSLNDVVISVSMQASLYLAPVIINCILSASEMRRNCVPSAFEMRSNPGSNYSPCTPEMHSECVGNAS